MGALLTPLAATLDGHRILVISLGKVLLEMESYIWRPPWFGQIGYMQEVDRRFAVERDKRKPPW